MLPRGCCSCCKDENEMAPHERLPDDDGYSFGCADFCGSSSRMSEGRHSQIVLLDDRRLDILIKPKLYAGELLDMVASHFSLKEKEYFGLAYLDDTGHYSWLQLDRRVLEHEFPKRSAQSTLLLYFRIKYFVESITHLKDRATVEAFYLQTQSLVYNGVLDISTDKVFQLAALVLQATHGDFTSDETAKQQLKKVPVLPTSALADHPSLLVCEERVLEQYRYAQGQSRGTAIVNYMRIAESLPTYGVHYYEVKDKANIPWWLGISYKGICQYDYADRKVPRKLFLWKQLENLYYRDRKFSIEVSDTKRITASRKTFSSGSICVYVWFSSSPSLTKCIWLMACSQHQFYLDRRHNKQAFSPSRNLSDIADELSHGSYSTETSSLGRSVSSLSLPALKLDSDSCDEMLDTGEMFMALKARKEALEEVLRRKCDELRSVCLREGELTGALPPEMPLIPGAQIPTVQRKPGTDIQDNWLLRKKTKDEEECASLELEYAIQNKIVTAAFKLLSDASQKKNIRRQRKLTHQKAVVKMKEIEQKLAIFKKEHIPKSLNYSSTEYDVSAKLKDLSITFTPTEKERDKNSLGKMTTSKSSPVPLPSHLSSSVPSSPARAHKQQRSSLAERPDITFSPAGYTPSTIYQTRTSYRSQQYPTFSMRSPTSCSSASSGDGVAGFGDRGSALIALTAPYRNKFESTLDLDGSNLYSVPTQRTSQAFDTQDDILATIPVSPQDLGLVSRHNSLDRNRRHSFQKYRQYLETLTDCSQPTAVLACNDTNQNSVPPHPPATSFSDYGFRHPHHYHHHRHQEVAHAQQAASDRNMFQKNLTMYASDAMFVGSGRHDENIYKNRYSSPLSPEPVKRWTEFSAIDSNSRTIISPCVQQGWPPKVQTSTSMDALKPHAIPNYSGSTTDSISAGAKNRTILNPSKLPVDQNWPSKVQTSTSMSSLKSHVGPIHSGPNVNVVSYGHFQPYWEETKPYETSDFYKYSTKHRKQHQVASQNLQAKLIAWKASQTSGQYTSGVSSSMSPVIERSRPGSAFSSASGQQGTVDDGKLQSCKLKQEGSHEKLLNTTSDSFHDDAPIWYCKHEKGKKTTLV